MISPLPGQALLFDLDGTLVDSAPDLWRAMNHVLALRHCEPLPLEMVRHLVGHGARALLARGLCGDESAEPPVGDADFEAAVVDFLDYYAEHLTDHSRPYPEVIEVLTELTARGFMLAVVTNKPERFSRAMLKQLNLEKFFPVVIGGDTLPMRKPDPMPLLHALERLNVTNGRGIMIGDSETDLSAARRAGVPVILCSHGYNRGQDVRTLHPDHVVDCFGQLPDFLHFS
ncbi:MAG: phosphoglycolate phosphatase [Magnetococcus sp. YQC-9]